MAYQHESQAKLSGWKRFVFQTPDQVCTNDVKKNNTCVLALITSADECSHKTPFFGSSEIECMQVAEPFIAYLQTCKIEIYHPIAIEDILLWHIIVEHNTWECESWAFGFPATKAIGEQMRALESQWKSRTTKLFVHDLNNIGCESGKFTFLYNKPDWIHPIFSQCVRQSDSVHQGYKKVYNGGSLLEPFNVISSDPITASHYLDKLKDGTADIDKGFKVNFYE